MTWNGDKVEKKNYDDDDDDHDHDHEEGEGGGDDDDDDDDDDQGENVISVVAEEKNNDNFCGTMQL